MFNYVTNPNKTPYFANQKNAFLNVCKTLNVIVYIVCPCEQSPIYGLLTACQENTIIAYKHHSRDSYIIAWYFKY